MRHICLKLRDLFVWFCQLPSNIINRLNVNMIDGQWYWMKVETIVDYHHQLCLNWALVLWIKVLGEALISYPCFFCCLFFFGFFISLKCLCYDFLFAFSVWCILNLKESTIAPSATKRSWSQLWELGRRVGNYAALKLKKFFLTKIPFRDYLE